MKPNERRAAIAAKFKPGVAVTDVAAAMSLKYDTTYGDFRALGWPRNDPNNRRGAYHRNPERTAAILAVLRAAPERTLDSIGMQFGITRERVRQIAAKAGEKKPRSDKHRPRGHGPKYIANRERIAGILAAREEMHRQILALVAEGFTGKTIAATVGCSCNLVSKTMLRAGLRAKGHARKARKVAS